MGWYRVIKTVKGHRYLYEQRSWREGKKVRTESRYIGRAGGGKAGATKASGQRRVITTPKANPLEGLASFGKAMLNQFDISGWGAVTVSQLGLVERKRIRKRVRKSRKSTSTRPQIAAQYFSYPYKVTIAHTAFGSTLIHSGEKAHGRQTSAISEEAIFIKVLVEFIGTLYQLRR